MCAEIGEPTWARSDWSTPSTSSAHERHFVAKTLHEVRHLDSLAMEHSARQCNGKVRSGMPEREVHPDTCVTMPRCQDGRQDVKKAPTSPLTGVAQSPFSRLVREAITSFKDEAHVHFPRSRCGVFVIAVCNRPDLPEAWRMSHPWMCLST